MDQAGTKSLDTSQVAEKSSARTTDAGHSLLSIVGSVGAVGKDAVALVVNNVVVEPINAGLNGVNAVLELGTQMVDKSFKEDFKAPQSPKIQEMQVDKAEPGSMAAYSQQIFGTAASFLAYAAAAKITGGVLRGVGNLAPAELAIGEFNAGNVLRSVAQSSRVATVLGATAYAGLKDTHDGESHKSNAVSAFVGFSFFEAGNKYFVSPGAGVAEKFGQRFVVGMIGGNLQADVASEIQTHKGIDLAGLTSSSISGGFLNALLPSGHGIIDGVMEHPLIGARPNLSEAATRLHVEAARLVPEGHAPEPGSWADPNAIKAINKAGLSDLHTKLVANDALPTRIVHKENVIYAGKDDQPLSVLQELAHARVFKKPEYESQFQAHAEKLVSTNSAEPRNAEAKESYIQTRLDQEIEARTFQNSQAEALHAPLRVSVDRNEIRDAEGYGRTFAQEADNFVTSGGKFRPEVDHSSGPNQRNYSREKIGGITIHTFNNVDAPGAKPFEQGDLTSVGFGYEKNGRIRVDFGPGEVHNFNFGDSIKNVRVVDKNDGEFQYYFNGQTSHPQLTVFRQYKEIKLVHNNGDKILITQVNAEGANLPFKDGTKFSIHKGSDGRMTVKPPGRPEQEARLGAEPARLAIVERSDGSKLFQLANASASKKVDLKVEPTIAKPTPTIARTAPIAKPAPPPVHFKAPADPRYDPKYDPRYASQPKFKEIPPRTPKELPKEFRNDRIQGGATQSSAGHAPFDSGVDSHSHESDDRYPLQPNIYQDPMHQLTGVDQRSGLDLSDPQQVLVGQMGLYGPLEHHIANLGRHGTEDDFDPWGN
jgi:hypothetical protein